MARLTARSAAAFLAGITLVLFFSSPFAINAWGDYQLRLSGGFPAVPQPSAAARSEALSTTAIATAATLCLGAVFIPLYLRQRARSKWNAVAIALFAAFFCLIVASSNPEGVNLLSNLNTIARYLNEILIATACTLVVAHRLRPVMAVTYAVILASLLYLVLTRGASLLTRNILGGERLVYGAVFTETGSMYAAAILLVFLCNAIPCYTNAKPRWFGALEWATASGSFIACLLSHSRGSLAALALAAVVYRRRNPAIVVPAILAAAGLALSVALAEPGTHPLVRDTVTGDITTGRIALWTTGVELLTSSPHRILYGFRSLGGLHNVLLGLWWNYGLPAAATYIAIHATALILLLRTQRSPATHTLLGDLPDRILAVFAATLFIGMIENNLDVNLGPIAYLHYYLIGLLLLLNSSWTDSLHRAKLPDRPARPASLPTPA